MLSRITPNRFRTAARARLLRLFALTLGLLLVVAACASDDGDPAAEGDDGTEATGEDTQTEAETEDEETSEPEGDDGGNDVVAPLDDGFPSQPITLWNAFDPGHTDDLFNQVVATIARDYSPVQINTDSQPQGPALQYGLVDFLQTQPGVEDGYHVYAISYFGGSLRPATVDVLADRTVEDLFPINSMVEAPFVMAVAPDSEWETLEEVEQYAADNPGELVVVGSSQGSGLHSSLLVWADQAGIEFQFLPTDGAGESRNVMLGGGADLGLVTYDPGLEDQVKILAQTGDTPMSTIPDVPTTADLGYEIPAGSFRGVATIPGVPDEHIEWYTELFRKVFEDPRFEEEMPGFTLNYRGAEDTAELQRSIQDTFIPVLEEAGLTVD